MPDGTTYEQDFHRWTQDQARRLRAAATVRSNLDVDWENVAEEIESLGRSDKRELESRLDTIYEHLLKLRFSPATQPRYGWMDSVDHARSEVERLLRDSPSLTQSVYKWTVGDKSGVEKRTARSLERHGEKVAGARLMVSPVGDIVARVLEDGFFPTALHEPDDPPSCQEAP